LLVTSNAPSSPLDAATAQRVSTNLVRFVKLLKAARAQAPLVHPEVESVAYPALFNLAEGERRVSALAEAIHSDISTTSRQVSTLAGHGLLEKLADPEDGRAQVVRLTPAGQELFATIPQQGAAWFQGLLDGWTVQAAADFAAGLEHFIASLEDSLAARSRRASSHRTP
jgi:DNA-binding MarR family transcriptional regulator